MKARLEYQDQKSHKFWEIEVTGASYTVRYGKVGSNGQTKTKELANPEAAEEAAEKLIAQKRRKGYADAVEDEAAPSARAEAGFDLDRLLERVAAFDPDGQPAHAVQYDDGPAQLAIHRAANAALGLEMVRLFNLERGDELVAIRGGCGRDGVYHLNHEAGLITVEELDGDAHSLFGLLDFTDEDEWAALSADAKIEALAQHFELEPIGDLFAELTVESLQVPAAPELDVSVEVVVPATEAHATFIADFDGAQFFGWQELNRVDPDGTITRRGEISKMAIRCSCTFDGALYLGGASLWRLMPGEEPVELPIADDVPKRDSYGRRVLSLVEHQGALWAGGRDGSLMRLVDGVLTLHSTIENAEEVHALASSDQGLWIAPFKKGLKRLDSKGKLQGGGVRAGDLVDVLISRTGAVLVVTRSGDQVGFVYRRPPGEKKFEKYPLPRGFCTRLVQLTGGRLVGSGLRNRLYVSDDDGCTFLDVDHGFMGYAGSPPEHQPSARDFECAAVVGDAAYVGGPCAPLLRVR